MIKLQILGCFFLKISNNDLRLINMNVTTICSMSLSVLKCMTMQSLSPTHLTLYPLVTQMGVYQ